MAESKPREVKMGRGPMPRGPRPKLENPGKILARVFSYVFRDYLIHVILVVVCIITSVLCSIKGTMFLRTLINDHITPMLEASLAGQAVEYSGLLPAILFMAVIYLIGVVAGYVQNKLMIYVTQGTLNNMRFELFSKMERLPIKYFDTHAHGDIMSIYTNDIDTLRQMISQSLPQILNSAITIVSVFISMIILSPVLTGVTMFMVVLMLFATGKAAGGSSRYFAHPAAEAAGCA